MILNSLPWKWTEIILLFLRLHPSTAYQNLFDYEGYSISSKEFLPTVIDIVVIWIKFSHSSPFYKGHWFLKCLCSLLPSPVWPQLVYLNSWTWHSRCLCNIAHYSIRLYFHHQSHPWLVIFFHFGSISSFFLELYFYSSPVAYWAPTNLESSSFSVLSFCPFILFMWISKQEYWSGLPFPSPVDHVWSELSTMTCPFWVGLHGMAHSFIESNKAMVRVISLISFLWLWFSFCLPFDG